MIPLILFQKKKNMASYKIRRRLFTAPITPPADNHFFTKLGKGLKYGALSTAALGVGAAAYGMKKAGDVVDAGTSAMKTGVNNITQGAGDALNNMTMPTPPQQRMNSDHSYYRQRLFDEGDGEGGGNKVIKGALAAGGSALAFYGARKGLFGNALQRGSNKAWGKLGLWTQKAGNKIGDNAFGNGMKSLGDKMTTSAANEYGMASALNKGLVKEAEVFGKKGTEVNIANTHIANEAAAFKKNLYGGHDTFDAMNAASK